MNLDDMVSEVKEIVEQDIILPNCIYFCYPNEDLAVLPLPSFSEEEKEIIFHRILPELIKRHRPVKIFAVLNSYFYMDGRYFRGVSLVQTQPDGVDIIVIYKDKGSVKELDLRSDKPKYPLFENIVKTFREIWKELI